MERKDITALLLDRIILRDEKGLCEDFIHRAGTIGIPYWILHRWDRQRGRFRLIYPGHLATRLPLPSSLTPSLEAGPILVETARFGQYQRNPETKDYASMLLVPLGYDLELVGLLQGFSPDDAANCRELVRRFDGEAQLVARALHLMELLEEREKLAFTDSLTGLFNYEFLVRFLPSEIARCGRYEREVSLLFLDIDWFKRVNDAHGHLVGSDVLKEFGRVLQGNLRASDIVVRYGGDEYVVVLAEAGIENAGMAAERLRRRVEEHVFGRDRGLTIRLTASTGIASYPEHGLTAGEIIDAADKAMYQVKQTQLKNHVEVALTSR